MIQIAKQRTNDFLGPAAVVTDSHGLGRVDEGERSIPWEGSYVPLSTQHHYPMAAETGVIFNCLLPLISHRVRSLCPMLVAAPSLACPLAL